MKSEYRLAMEYHINEIEGENNVEEFLCWVFYDVMGLKVSPIDIWEGEIKDYYMSGSTIGSVDITETGGYYSVWFKFNLNNQQASDIKGFNNSLDILVEHLVTKYRLRWVLRFYQELVRIRGGLYKDRYSSYRGASYDVHHKMLRVCEYLAKRKLRNVAVYKELS